MLDVRVTTTTALRCISQVKTTDNVPSLWGTAQNTSLSAWELYVAFVSPSSAAPLAFIGDHYVDHRLHPEQSVVFDVLH